MLQAGLTPVIEWTGESGDCVYISGEVLTTFPVIWHVFNLNQVTGCLFRPARNQLKQPERGDLV